jgi:hypothetical protein
VRLHEWTTGESSSQVLFSVADMMGWKFYDSAKAWRSALAEYESNKATAARLLHAARTRSLKSLSPRWYQLGTQSRRTTLLHAVSNSAQQCRSN